MADNKSRIWQAGLEALVASTPIIGPSAVAMIRAANDSEEAGSDLDKLADEARRQTFELQMAEMQAQVAQEIAIAMRIQNAEEVEIEEYFEGEGEGNLGAKGDSAGISLGLSGKGRRVTRRVLRFKGKPSIGSDPIRAEAGAAANGGPAKQLGDSGVTEGPPSVS